MSLIPTTNVTGPAIFRKNLPLSTRTRLLPQNQAARKLFKDHAHHQIYFLKPSIGIYFSQLEKFANQTRDQENDMISIEVGQGLKVIKFLVSKAPLCQKVPFFMAMFSNGWLETGTQSCTLPEDDPEAFSILLHWVFDVPYDGPVIFTSDGLQIHIDTFIQLIVLADKYLIDEFTSIIKTTLMQRYCERLISPSRNIPKVSWYRLGWEILPRESTLREYFTREYGGPRLHSNTVYVTRKMLKEWQDICAGRKDIRGDLKTNKIDARSLKLNEILCRMFWSSWRSRRPDHYIDRCSHHVHNRGYCSPFEVLEKESYVIEYNHTY